VFIHLSSSEPRPRPILVWYAASKGAEARALIAKRWKNLLRMTELRLMASMHYSFYIVMTTS